MRTALIVGICFLAGCSQEPTAWQQAMRAAGEEVVAKQDESLTILKDNTTALAAIKSQVEDVKASLVETRQAVGTMEASLVKSEAQQLGGDPKTSPPESPAKANTPTGPIKVATPGTSSPVVMKWNIEGNWNPTILETARHLREDHGIIADGMSHQQMHDAHAAAHEGRPVAIKQQPVQIVNQGTYCPNGQCPMPRQVKVKRRR